LSSNKQSAYIVLNIDLSMHKLYTCTVKYEVNDSVKL